MNARHPAPHAGLLPDGIASILMTYTHQRTHHPAADDLALPLDRLPEKALYDLRLARERAQAAAGMAITGQPLARRRAQLVTACNALDRSGALIAAAIERLHHEIAQLTVEIEAEAAQQRKSA